MSQDSNTQGAVATANTNTQGAVVKPKTHPLGELIECKVVALSKTEENHDIHVSINKWSFDIQQNTKVKLPKGIIKFLQDAYKVDSKIGAKGFAEEVQTPLYAVTTLL